MTMNQNPNFELERQKLNQTYEKMNAGKTSSHDDGRIPTYWTFLKLRIGFSILLLFFSGRFCESLSLTGNKTYSESPPADRSDGSIYTGSDAPDTVCLPQIGRIACKTKVPQTDLFFI